VGSLHKCCVAQGESDTVRPVHSFAVGKTWACPQNNSAPPPFKRVVGVMLQTGVLAIKPARS
jgi:hypothetical protein